MALVYGDISGGEGILIRLHSECLTGDAFGSQHCECGEQLDSALRAIVAEGRGVLVYLRGHEGRGIGLLAKLQAMKPVRRGWTPSRPTSPSVCRWTPATTGWRPRCCTTSA